MTDRERCRHPDCIYRNNSDPTQTGQCNYLVLTGESRTAKLPERLKLPCNCPRYVPNGKAIKQEELSWDEIARKLYDAGATDREIGEAVGKAGNAIGSHRRKVWGLPPNKDRMGPAPRFDFERAAKLYREGKNDREIAEALECSQSHVWRWREKNGLPVNGWHRKGEK